MRRVVVVLGLCLAALPSCSASPPTCVSAGAVAGTNPVFALPTGLYSVPASEHTLGGDPTWYVASPQGGVWLVSRASGRLDDRHGGGLIVPINETATNETGSSDDVRADPPGTNGATDQDDEARQALACAAEHDSN